MNWTRSKFIQNHTNNKGGYINTTHIFDFSRGVLEMLLGSNKQVNCINVSDGAKIEHASYLEQAQLPKLKEIKNKQQVVEQYLNNSFSDDYVISHDLSAEFKTVTSGELLITSKLI